MPTIAPSAVREDLHRNFPREMDQYDIDRVIKAFGQAARRCKEGGLDGLETLAGGHLIGQFFRPERICAAMDLAAALKTVRGLP